MTIKEIFKKIYCFIESVGVAHAAATLAREGYHKEAAALMTNKRDCD